MVVQLIGGPLDGSAIDGPARMPAYVVITSHKERPVYRSACCAGCGSERKSTPYYFLGYEDVIQYEHPQKAQSILPIETASEASYVSDSQSRIQ